MEEQATRVELGPCTCPGTPHPEGDWVELRPKLGMARALAVIRGAALADVEVAEMQLAVGYARFGISAWNLSNGTGQPQPLDGEHLEAFAEGDPRSIIVALEGDKLYSEEVIAPLRMMGGSSSQPLPSTASTSAPSGTEPSTQPRRRSRRSSTTTTPTAGTEATSRSRGGGSNG